MKHKISVATCKVRGVSMWRVRWRDAGRVHRKFFTNRDAADAHAATVHGDSITARKRISGLTQPEIEQLLLIRDEAERLGLSLLSVISVMSSAQTGEKMGCEKVLNEMISAKLKAGRARPYVDSLSQIVGNFIKGRENLAIDQVGFQELEKFIDAHNLASRSTLRARLSTWFKFAIRAGYIKSNPCERLESIRHIKASPRIFTEKEIAKALKWLRLNPRIFGWFVLSTYAGLRPEEAQKTQWKMIHFDEGWIRVEAQTSKKAQRRVVYPPAKAMHLLKEAKRKKSKLPLTTKQLQTERIELRSAIGFKTWHKDVTRHTAASMWLASTDDVKTVSHQIGNSERVLLRDYKALVTKVEAEKFWAISPISKHKYSPNMPREMRSI